MTWISMKEKKLNSDMMLTLAIYVKNAVVKFLIYFTSDCIGSCKSNYHTITATAVPNDNWKIIYGSHGTQTGKC
jgi:hypothetical protein